jgi:light-regulated signal transduction histidine kinase (bacteriophytochrome)
MNNIERAFDKALGSQNQTILIIDDEPANLAVLADYLAQSGFQIMVAQTGEAGLELARRTPPDLILLDVRLPGVDGFETCRRLKAAERTWQIPVIFMTVLSRVQDKVKGFEAGGVDHISKPFQQEEVLARVTTHLRLRELTRELEDAKENLERHVAERTAQLESAIKEHDAFTYIVAHDLRAPLRHIDGFLGILREHTAATLDEQSQHYMANISDAAERMGILVDNLLSFSRMGRQEMSKKEVNLDELVEDVLRGFKPETEGKVISWHIGLLPVVIGDRATLRIVLVNLISNALKYTRLRSQAEIEIGCLSGQEKETVVFVRDNGAGFDMKYANKLFGVFQRLHRADEFEGIGIGLANVQRIIARHGGKTWAEGEVGQGATFYFSLPKAKKET